MLSPNARSRLPAPVDAALCAAAVWVATTTQPSAGIWTQERTTPVWMLVAALGVVGLLVRSRMPRVCLGLLTACLALHLVAYAELSLLAGLVGVVGAWTAQSRLRAPLRTVTTSAVYVAAIIGLARAVSSHSPAAWDLREVVIMVVVVWSLLTVATLAGASRRRARERVAGAIERAQMIRRTAAAQQRAAVAAERTRIARDVHDLLGHSLAVIGMQAAGAQAVVRSDPGAVQEALAVIGRTARSSSQEVRDLVDLLHDDAEPADRCDSPPDAAASPYSAEGIEELVQLIDSFRQAGMETSLTLVYRAAARPSAVTVLGQVLREALTNAARHAPGQDVRTSLEISTHGCELMVVNTLSDPPARPSHRIGTGTASMRSRLEAVGGRLEAGPQDGRWVLHAVVPQEVS